MSKYFDSINACNHSPSLVNLLNEENFEDEICASNSVGLLDDMDETTTFCVRCRSLSNTSNISGEWDGSYHECNGHIVNSVYQGEMQRHLLINDSDGAHVPLLSNGDNFSTSIINPLHNEDADHCHTSLPASHNSKEVQQLIAAMVLCFVFMFAEVVGGYLAGSLAIMTDAAHLASDFVGFLVSLIAICVGKKQANKRFTFGYHRAEILGALLSIAMIWLLTGIFIYVAIERIIHRDFQINADTMMIVAAVGIVINIFMGLVLHGVCSGVSHNHGHSHGLSETDSIVNSHSNHHKKNINIRAAFIHVVGDLIQSIGVFIASIIIKFYPSADLVDPSCTLLFSLIALTTTAPVLKESFLVLMEAFPRCYDYNTLVSSFLSVEGVKTIHSLHVWSLTLNTNALAVHLAIDASTDPDIIRKRALGLIRRKFNIYNATIQVEKYSPDPMPNCLQCKPLEDY